MDKSGAYSNELKTVTFAEFQLKKESTLYLLSLYQIAGVSTQLKQVMSPEFSV
jgi:hypothetical protein